MSITELGLLVREEPMRHNEVQLVLGPGHGHVVETAPLGILGCLLAPLFAGGLDGTGSAFLLIAFGAAATVCAWSLPISTVDTTKISDSAKAVRWRS